MHDPQREESWDILCPRCRDIAQKHWVPGYPIGLSCPTCDDERA